MVWVFLGRFLAFDLVLLPAVKSARLDLISESLDTNRIKYKKELSENQKQTLSKNQRSNIAQWTKEWLLN